VTEAGWFDEGGNVGAQIVGERVVDETAAHEDLGDERVSEAMGPSYRACNPSRSRRRHIPDRCRASMMEGGLVADEGRTTRDREFAHPSIFGPWRG
jgi:hypothetical protein